MIEFVQNLRTVKGTVQLNPDILSEGKIRWWIFKEEENGFSNVVVRKGNRVFIDVDALSRWLEEGRGS